MHRVPPFVTLRKDSIGLSYLERGLWIQMSYSRCCCSKTVSDQARELLPPKLQTTWRREVSRPYEWVSSQ